MSDSAQGGVSPASAEASRVRLFVAVDVPEPVGRAVEAAAARLRPRPRHLRWPRPASWHITVAFLGWTDAAVVGAVGEALARTAARARAFSVGLTGRAGTFGGTRARVLWAELAPSPALADLAGKVQAEMADLGFEFDQRAFRGHLTLARAGRGQRIPQGLAEAYEGPATSWEVRRLTLMRSHLARAGSRYEALASWGLEPRAEDA
ncbi:MAG TPA: RNA 2',3'-cyclic phosphodiesterase [Egibacteraceae bacterium]|nr:RNA 2',3'-cyclic phosphodiesterase [Egibacteraceae bacterium]